MKRALTTAFAVVALAGSLQAADTRAEYVAKVKGAMKMEFPDLNPAAEDTIMSVFGIVSSLNNISSITELYKIQHGGKVPTDAQLENWATFLKTTDAAGNIGKGDYGPYMQYPLMNPLNGKTKIVPLGKADADTGWVYRRTDTKLEVIPVLPTEYLDVLGKPKYPAYWQLVDAKVDKEQVKKARRLSHLQSTVSILRSQVMLYALQHESKSPTFEQIKDWKVLLERGEIPGVNRKIPVGPYIAEKPINPVTGKIAIAPAGKATLEDGWSYELRGKECVIRYVLPDERAAQLSGLDPTDYEIAK